MRTFHCLCTACFIRKTSRNSRLERCLYIFRNFSIGGSIGNGLGKLFRFDEKDKHIMITHAGLFGMLGEDVEVKDLVFARPTIQVTDDNQFVGVLAGESTQDNISNVHVFDGQIAGEADATIGGIVGGSFLYTNFNDCSFQGNINTPEASPVGGTQFQLHG